MRKCFTVRVLLAWLSLLLLSSCGTNDVYNSNGPPISQVAHLNSGKAFGYYGDCTQSCFSEYGNHVTFYQSAPWSHDLAQISNGLSQAIVGNKSIILSIPNGDVLLPDCNNRIISFFTYLDSQNLLKNIFAVYPKDEYNLNRKLSEEQIRTANKCVRGAMANFPALAGKPLYGIYSCADPLVAIDDLDIIACDWYEIGDDMLERFLPVLKSYGKPIFLIPAGACDWNYNPYAMVVAANSDDQIIGLHAFLWPDNTWQVGKCGIKSSSVSGLYQSLIPHP